MIVRVWGQDLESGTAEGFQSLIDCVGLITANGALVAESAAPEVGGFISDEHLYNGVAGIRNSDEAARPALDVLLRRLFVVQHRGMGGPYDFGGIVNADLNAFRNLAYGLRIPACALDPGVALFVKSLSLLGLHTVYSCDGHGIERPHVAFHSVFHLRWARHWLGVLFPGMQGFVAVEGDGWMGNMLSYSKSGCEAWRDFVAMGRHIIDNPKQAAHIRAAKPDWDGTLEGLALMNLG